MTAIGYDKIKISSPWEIQSIYELSIKQELNEHAKMQLKALLSESSGAQAGLNETVDAQVKVIIADGDSEKYLFIGRLIQANISATGGVYTLTAYFFSETLMLDREEKSRSFQNTKLTFPEIVEEIMKEYPDKNVELTAPKIQLNIPLIQYQETDWQFIKRLASYQETVIIPDIVHNELIFTYGYPKGSEKELPAGIAYASGKNMEEFYKAHAYNPCMIANEYTYFEVETYEQLTIGDIVSFHNYEMVVGELNISIKQGVLVYTAKLVRKITIRQQPIQNKKLIGISLQGKVLALQNQQIKLHLTIDEEQNEDEAYWYPFVPPTTDMMYLMPQLNTMVSLYIPGSREQDAIITGCVRTNGTSCTKTGDPNTRYLGTEYGQELKLAPGGIYITAGRSNLIANFDDAEGVTLSSHKGMILNAEQEIVINSKKMVSLSANSQLLVSTPSAGISMEGEIHILAASKVYIDRTGGLG